MTIHFLLLGASGYVGSEFAKQILSRQHFLTSVSRNDINVYDVESLSQTFRNFKPDVVINCAGYTGKPNVDACELDKANCLAGNAYLPAVISEACGIHCLPWIHVSSGCIYTGRRPDGKGFKETDPPNFSFRQNNCSFYSGTKALGEEIVADDPRCYLLRLRIPFSRIHSPRNYLSKLITYKCLLEAENSLSYLPEFVSAAIDCVEMRIPFGIYNLTNPGSVHTTEVVQMIKDAKITEKEFRFFASESEFMTIAAKTPRSNCVLDSSKAIDAGLRLSPVTSILRECLENWTTLS